MLDRDEINRAVDMQSRSYLLLKWVASAIKKDFIDFRSAHTFATLPTAAAGWIRSHYENIPAEARPEREDLLTFAEFFSTYLDNSFEIVSNPGKQLYSPDAHCFCPICSWLIDAPNLKTRKVAPVDKRRAEKLKAEALRRISREVDLDLTDEQTARLLADKATNENAALVAYGHDLLQRMKGVGNGPAVLALWRGFAWTKEGSPKPKFKLSAKGIFTAEDKLVEVIKLIEA